MEDLDRYRQIIKDLIREYAQYRPACSDVKIEVVFDESQDHYALVYAGWTGIYRLHGSVIHIDIEADGRVWIQHDGIEEGVTDRLVEAGIPRDRIVLGFKHPEMRSPQ